MTLGAQARRFLRAHQLGVLATHSASVPGYPFGSVTPLVTDHAGNPVILISALAEHTRSLAVDSRAALIVHDFALPAQAGPRLTVVGDAATVDATSIAPRYLGHFPGAAQFLALGDFAFWRIEVHAALYVRGFGRIDWVTGADFAAPASSLAASETDIVAHMNEDHAAALGAYCRHQHGVEAPEARMIAIDCDGFDVRAADRTLRFDFDAPVSNAAAARQALVALARRSRPEAS